VFEGEGRGHGGFLELTLYQCFFTLPSVLLGKVLAISLQLFPRSRICLSRCSSAGVHGVLVRPFFAGGGADDCCCAGKEDGEGEGAGAVIEVNPLGVAVGLSPYCGAAMVCAGGAGASGLWPSCCAGIGFWPDARLFLGLAGEVEVVVVGERSWDSGPGCDIVAGPDGVIGGKSVSGRPGCC
jgi:hypothetical protein